MLRSMYSGVSGLRNHQLKMDVVGNNIANVNTMGFKASRVTFQDMFSQTSRSASASMDNIGGTNPQQVGLGITAAAINVLHGPGAYQRTDRALDVMIAGDGFLVVQKGLSGSEETYYTRAGALEVVPGAGSIDTTVGTETVTNDYFYLVDPNGLFVMGIQLDGVSRDAATGDLAHDASTAADPTSGDLGELDTMNRIIIGEQYTSISIDKNGVLWGVDTTSGSDEPVAIAQMAVGNFVNPAGLSKEGDNLYAATSNSGAATYNSAGTGGTGELKTNGLEMSNVDLSQEFTEMIVTQRGFQACSRIITVSDTLLEELVNLKR